MTRFLSFFADNGRIVLIVGLLAGVVFPSLALAMKPWLPVMIAFVLFIAALRIGLQPALGGLGDFRLTLAVVLAYQIAIPIVLYSFFSLFGTAGIAATAIVLMTAASSISGSPNIVLMTGNDPAPALRLLVVGTALLPLTVIPVFTLVPDFGTVETILLSAGKLLALIVGSAAVAWTIRRLFFSNATGATWRAVDGLSAIGMAVLVIGLMSAMGPALRSDPWSVFTMLTITCTINLGLQLFGYTVFGMTGRAKERVSGAVVCGNRNMALFLAALPAGVMDPLLLFIGCYQVPMYLTPILLGWLYKSKTASGRLPES
ncbi:MAG: hypothetical protein ACR2PF_13495 [Rhizobiaceae bacterium]